MTTRKNLSTSKNLFIHHRADIRRIGNGWCILISENLIFMLKHHRADRLAHRSHKNLWIMLIHHRPDRLAHRWIFIYYFLFFVNLGGGTIPVLHEKTIGKNMVKIIAIFSVKLAGRGTKESAQNYLIYGVSGP